MTTALHATLFTRLCKCSRMRAYRYLKHFNIELPVTYVTITVSATATIVYGILLVLLLLILLLNP